MKNHLEPVKNKQTQQKPKADAWAYPTTFPKGGRTFR